MRGSVCFYLHVIEWRKKKKKKERSQRRNSFPPQRLLFGLRSCTGGQFKDVPESDFAPACAFYLLEALLDHRA